MVKPPKISLGEFVRALLHDVRITRNAVEAHIERLKQQATLLDSHVGRLESIEVRLTKIPKSNGGGKMSVPVARSLSIQRHPDGSVAFMIDRRKTFKLARQLAEVFEFIASGEKDRSGEDPLVSWRKKSKSSRF